MANHRRAMIDRLKSRARTLKNEIAALALASHDPRTPLVARAVIWCVILYAASPIDLVPDPIPVIGYLDDLFLLPAGIALAIKLIPANVMAECRVAAASDDRPERWLGAVLVVTIWLSMAAAGFWLVRKAI